MKKRSIIIISFVLLAFFSLHLNDFGLIKLFQLQKKHSELKNELNNLLIQQVELNEDIQKLKTDENYIQKIAREKYMMVEPGERVYRVQDEKTLSTN